jgi:hypothetical protein
MTKMKKKMKKTNLLSRAEELAPYLGQYVIIQLKNVKIAIENEQDSEIAFNTGIGGFFLDIGDNYIHLGDTPYGFNKAVDIEEVAFIEATNPPDQEMILDGDVIPNKEDMN